MALTERSRNALYEGLTGFIDPEAVGEMLSYFPARDVEEPASRELVRAECALVRAEVSDVRVEVSDVRVEVSQLRADMEQRFGHLERQIGELRADGARQVDLRDLSVRVDQIVAELRAEVRTSRRWTIGAMVSLSGVVVAATAALG